MYSVPYDDNMHVNIRVQIRIHFEFDDCIAIDSAEIGHSTDWMIVLILTNYVESRNANPSDFMVMKIEFIFATEVAVFIEIIVELVVGDELKSWIIVYEIVPKCIQICIISWENLSSGYIIYWGKWKKAPVCPFKTCIIYCPNSVFNRPPKQYWEKNSLQEYR